MVSTVLLASYLVLIVKWNKKRTLYQRQINVTCPEIITICSLIQFSLLVYYRATRSHIFVGIILNWASGMKPLNLLLLFCHHWNILRINTLIVSKISFKTRWIVSWSMNKKYPVYDYLVLLCFFFLFLEFSFLRFRFLPFSSDYSILCGIIRSHSYMNPKRSWRK